MVCKQTYIRSKYGDKTPLERLLELFPDKNWHWHYLSENPNITWETVRANPDKPWYWWHLSENKFLYDDTVYKRTLSDDTKKEAERTLYSVKSLYKDVIGLVLDFLD